MKNLITIIFFALLRANFVSGQQVKIKSTADLKGVPFATISYKKNDSIVGGTYSGETGSATIDNQKFDKIVISHIGFEEKEIPKNKVDSIILLKEKVVELKEVIVSNKKLEARWIGTELQGNKVYISASRGFEFSTLIRIGDTTKIHNIKSLNFFIKRRKETKSAAVRITLYSNKNNTPGSVLNDTDITKIINSKQKGEVRINLENYNIVVNQDFFVGIEWLGLLDENENFIMNDSYNDCSLGFDYAKNKTVTYIRNKLGSNDWNNFVFTQSKKDEGVTPIIKVEIF